MHEHHDQPLSLCKRFVHRQCIHESRNTPGDLSIFECQEERVFAVLKHGVAGWIELGELICTHWGSPKRIRTNQMIRKVNKFAKFPGSGNPYDFHAGSSTMG